MKGFAKASAIDKEKVLEMGCDILIPVAAGSQVTVKNVKNVKAKIIADGANAPIAPDADHSTIGAVTGSVSLWIVFLGALLLWLKTDILKASSKLEAELNNWRICDFRVKIGGKKKWVSMKE